MVDQATVANPGWQLCAASIQSTSHTLRQQSTRWRGETNRRRQLALTLFELARFIFCFPFGSRFAFHFSLQRALSVRHRSVVSFSSVAPRVRHFCGASLLLFLLCSPQQERKIHTHTHRRSYSKNKFNFIAFPRRVIVCVCVCVCCICVYIYIYMPWKSNTKILICAKFDDYVLPVILFRCVYENWLKKKII